MGSDTFPRLPTPDGIREAMNRVRTHLPETPLLWSPSLSQLLGRRILLKLETISPIASFKLRGALVDIGRVLERRKLLDVVTSSSGNHGQGVALAARILGLKAHVFLPARANSGKVAMIRALGARIHSVDGDLYEAKEKAIQFAALSNSHFVDDGHSVDVMEGAGTIGLELAASYSSPSVVFVPVGDGALIGGTACALKAINPQTVVIGCQAEGAPSLTLSFKARTAVDVPARTVADGICSRRPTPLALNAMWRWVDDCQLVSDDEILSSMRTLICDGHVLVEPASAAALAVAWRIRNQHADRDWVILVTGANTTDATISQALSAKPLQCSNGGASETP